MHINLPLVLDSDVRITYNSGQSFITNIIEEVHITGEPFVIEPKINGVDAEHVRITNIVGHNGVSFLKRCPNPECDNPIKTVHEFGDSGRVSSGRRRDQSNCNNCRAKY